MIFSFCTSDTAYFSSHIMCYFIYLLYLTELQSLWSLIQFLQDSVLFSTSMFLQIFFIGVEGSFPTIPILQVLAEMHFNRVAFIVYPVQSSLPIPPLLFTSLSCSIISKILVLNSSRTCIFGIMEKKFNCKHDNNCQLFSACYVTSTRISSFMWHSVWPSRHSREATVIIFIS